MNPGDCIVSRCGRDKDRIMFVVGRLPSGDILVAEGRMRRMDKPKPKRCRHVTFHSSPQGAVPEKLRRGEKVTNAEIRKAIAEIGNQ